MFGNTSYDDLPEEKQYVCDWNYYVHEELEWKDAIHEMDDLNKWMFNGVYDAKDFIERIVNGGDISDIIEDKIIISKYSFNPFQPYFICVKTPTCRDFVFYSFGEEMLKKIVDFKIANNEIQGMSHLRARL